MDLFAKLQTALATFKEVKTKKDQKLIFRIEHAQQRNKAQNTENLMEEELIKLILQNLLSYNHTLEVRNAYISRHPGGHERWFKIVADSITPDTEGNQTTYTANETLLTAYREMLIDMTSLFKSSNINLAGISGLLAPITKHKLHLCNFSLNDQFFAAVNGFIKRTIINSVIHSDTAKLQTLKAIFDANLPTPLVNRSSELAYWLDRTTLEIAYNSDPKATFTVGGHLPEIFQFALYEKNGQKPIFSSIRSTYLEQLKAKEHPEACLKVAQLIAAKLSPAFSDMAFMDIGVNVIKAMTCAFLPGDGLGIYTTLGFDLISDLKTRVKKEGYTDAQRSIVHFYYALALFIKNSKLFHKDLTNFFEGKTYPLTARSALELFKNPKLIFDDEVKRNLLNRIVGLDNLIEPPLLKEAVAMLQRFPTVTQKPAASAPRENAPPPFNPAALQFVAENVRDASVPIPIPAVPLVATPSDQIDDTFHSAAPTSAPELTNTAIQDELAVLKLQYQKAQALLAQKDTEISSNHALLKEKEGVLGQCQAQLQQTQESLAKSEKRVAHLETKLSLFFQMNSTLAEQSKKLAADLETGNQLNP